MKLDAVRIGLLVVVGSCLFVIGSFCYHRANTTMYGVSYEGAKVCRSYRTPDFIKYDCRQD